MDSCVEQHFDRRLVLQSDLFTILKLSDRLTFNYCFRAAERKDYCRVSSRIHGGEQKVEVNKITYHYSAKFDIRHDSFEQI